MTKIRTVIIDNDHEERRGIRGILRRICQNVEIVGEADSAAAGMRQIGMTGPDLVILDIDMPLRSGFELLDGHPDRAFDLILVASNNRHAVRAVKYGPVDFLLKPVDETELQSAVDRIAAARTIQPSQTGRDER